MLVSHEENEAQKGQVACPRSPSQQTQTAKPALESSSNPLSLTLQPQQGPLCQLRKQEGWSAMQYFQRPKAPRIYLIP